MRCVLHIGVEKTGTSLIQSWLYDNSAALADQGIFLSDCIGRPANRHFAAFFSDGLDEFDASLGLRDATAKAAYFQRSLDALAQEVARRRDCDTLVISSEHLHSRVTTLAGVARVRAYLSKVVDDVSIICYVRDQCSLRRSLYSTALRFGFDGELDEFKPDISETDLYFNFYKSLMQWADVFGEDAVHVALYDRGSFVGEDLRRDFLKRALPDCDPAQLRFDQPTVNPGFDRVQIAMMRAVNAHFVEAGDGAFRKDRWFLIRNIGAFGGMDAGPPPDQLAPAIHARFKASNVALGRQFLGMDDNPFPPPQATEEDWRIPAVVAEEALARLSQRLLINAQAQFGIGRRKTLSGATFVRRGRRLAGRLTRWFRAGST